MAKQSQKSKDNNTEILHAINKYTQILRSRRKGVEISGVSKISFRGGSNFFWKSGGIAARGKATPLLGGSGACSPEKIFKNGAIWYVLESILLKILSKK